MIVTLKARVERPGMQPNDIVEFRVDSAKNTLESAKYGSIPIPAHDVVSLAINKRRITANIWSQPSHVTPVDIISVVE